MHSLPLSAGFAVLIILAARSAGAAPMILNEYNAVSSSNYLNGGDEFMDEDGNVPPPADPFFGRVLGNGGDWFELVVIADGLDIRGWQLEMVDNGEVQQRLVFTNEPLWASLSAGSLITVSEDVADDASYDPSSGDWWINVRAADTDQGGTGRYITADNFPVSNDDWQLRIFDASDQLVFGPAGEGIVDDDGVPLGVGVNSREVFKLEADPDALTLRYSSAYNDGKSSSFGSENVWSSGSAMQDLSALRLGLPVPDSDADGIGDDGNRSGIVGDAPCASGDTLDCDDNCPLHANAGQRDTNGDGFGNRCDADLDDDGVVNFADLAMMKSVFFTSDPDADLNGDGSVNFADLGIMKEFFFGVPGGALDGSGP